MALGIRSREKEALDLIRGIAGVAVLLVHSIGKQLEHAADVRRVRLAILVNDFAKHQHFARSEHVRRSPVEGGPVQT